LFFTDTVSDSDHSIVKEMKEVMLHKIEQYYGEDCDLGMLDKAMLLDPTFKNVTFVSSDIRIGPSCFFSTM